ncbi:P-loop NTPase fold protein [Shewanella sp. 10N.286.51.B2]|uniref:KAP family P-loop NTPase fold protein n=1 Tax=Shewanella sp. 10N.286.51.B2 TaxID=3229707 RepID=UPI003553C2DC
MVKQIELNWSESSTIDGDAFPEDRLGRAKYATFLTKVLASQAEDSNGGHKNYVLNLNAEWGAGKTYFLKRWSEDIKEHYPVVYVDAWKKDYSDDPLMTVISAIISQLRTQAGKDEDAKEFKVPRKLIGLLKAAAPGIGRGLFKRYVGIDPVDIMNAEDDNESIGNIKDEDGGDVTDADGQPIDMSFAASQMVKYLIDEHDAKSKAIESLKESVLEWVNAVVGLKQKSLPAFIFIDELDRCRPSYAVEMLETIKHIFDIKGVVFVVATDTEQLQHAVKAIYGEGFDAKIYLGRFFNSRYSLKAPNLENFLEVHCDIGKLSKDYFKKLGINVLPFNKDGSITLKNISVILEAFQVSVRTAIQITDRVIITIANLPKGSKIDILMLTTLLCIKENDSALFDEIVEGGFERAIVVDGKNASQTLPQFLRDYLPEKFHHQKLEMTFTPRDYHPQFDVLERAPQPNRYLEGTYYFELIEYLTSIFSPHFNSQTKMNKAFLLSLGNERASRDKQTPLQKIGSQLVTAYGACNRSTDTNIFIYSSINWIKFIYIKSNFESIDMEAYKDFVELASPLDWMGEDEIHDENVTG